MRVRFGVMVVGPTTSGKSATLNVLKKSFNLLREKKDPN